MFKITAQIRDQALEDHGQLLAEYELLRQKCSSYEQENKIIMEKNKIKDEEARAARVQGTYGYMYLYLCICIYVIYVCTYIYIIIYNIFLYVYVYVICKEDFVYKHS